MHDAGGRRDVKRGGRFVRNEDAWRCGRDCAKPRQPNFSTGPSQSIMNKSATTGPTPSGGGTGPPLSNEPAT